MPACRATGSQTSVPITPSLLAEHFEDRVDHVGVVRPGRLQAGRQAAGIQLVIGIEHEHVGCRRGREALVARRREPLVLRVAQQKRSSEPLVVGLQPIQDTPLTAVSRVVIDDHQVEIREVLGDDAVERFEDEIPVVIQRDSDRHLRVRVADRLEEDVAGAVGMSSTSRETFAVQEREGAEFDSQIEPLPQLVRLEFINLPGVNLTLGRFEQSREDCGHLLHG